MAKFLTLDDVEVKDKVVLVRVDFNSPIDPETKKIIGFENSSAWRINNKRAIRKRGKGCRFGASRTQG